MGPTARRVAAVSAVNGNYDDRGAISPAPPRRNYPEHARLRRYPRRRVPGRHGDIAAFDNTNRLAAVAGLAPVPRDSGRISGNLKRPRRYNRRLLRACYLASHNAIRTDTASRMATTANALKGNATPKPCWHLPAAASTSCGRCCATTSPINRPHLTPQRLDNFIENLFRDAPARSAGTPC